MIVLLSLSLATICASAFYLIMSQIYDDGLVGRIALVLMVFASGIGLWQFFKGYIVFNPVGTVLVLANALFLARQVFFLINCKTDKRTIYEDKRCRTRGNQEARRA
jgi:hypothetical protein